MSFQKSLLSQVEIKVWGHLVIPEAYMRICLRRNLYQITQEEEQNIKVIEENLLWVDGYEHAIEMVNHKTPLRRGNPTLRSLGTRERDRGETEAIDGDRLVFKPIGFGVNEYLLYHLPASLP